MEEMSDKVNFFVDLSDMEVYIFVIRQGDTKMATTYTLDQGFKVLAQRKAFSRAFPKAQTVEAWRVLGSDGSETHWTSVREEAITWGRMLQQGHRPMGAYC
jgi:hypothetical protein